MEPSNRGPGKSAILYVVKGYHGLPSIDPKCLQVLYFLKLNPNPDVRVVVSDYHTNPNLPVLSVDGKFYDAQNTIFKKLVEIGESSDNQCDSQTKSKIIAYKSLNSNTLNNSVNLYFWGIEDNNQYVTRMYGKGKYFPFRIVHARRLNKLTQTLVAEACDGMTLEESIRRNYEATENYFDILESLLNDADFLLGDAPNSLDAHVCGYLAPLLVLDFPNKGLTNILKRHQSLCTYIKRFSEACDYDVSFQYDSPAIDREHDNERAPFCLIVLAGFIAVASMVGYGVINDIIKVE